MTQKSRSARYYAKNPKARRKKAATDKKINARPEQRRKRSELVKKNRAADKRGVNRNGKDYDHATKRYISSSKNRGRRGEGGRKRKRH
jgi:hypothetical protein